MIELTSRQRILRAIGLQEVDHIPCCFMSFTALRQRMNDDWFDVAKHEQDMGLDAFLFIPATPRRLRLEHPDLRGLPIRFHPDVKTREWREEIPGEYGILHKEYTTPAGKLTTSVRLSKDWPHGNHIPFIDDYQIPRALKPLITGPEELAALQYLLIPPLPADIASFREEAKKARGFTEAHGLTLAGGWGVAVDMANWLCGTQNLMLWMIKQPGFISDLLDMISAWNRSRMEVVLSASIDLFFRRAWYEGCDFILPKTFQQTVLPSLKAEVGLVHEHKAKFGYICTSGTKPMFDIYLDAGLDVLVGIDPIQDKRTDLPLMKEKLGGKTCLWGGVSGAITVEGGSEDEVREAVRHAIKTLGPNGFILSPVDNITVDEPTIWQKIDVFIDEWRKAR